MRGTGVIKVSNEFKDTRINLYGHIVREINLERLERSGTRLGTKRKTKDETEEVVEDRMGCGLMGKRA